MRIAFRIAKGVGVALLAILALLALCATWFLVSIRQDEVTFTSGGLTLSGTLLSPRFGGSAPGVVLVHGSGETSRNSMMLYAWIFASQGYASLAYDKRGVGKSEGEPFAWREFSIDDLAADAAAGFKFLQGRANVDSRRVGFFGASQGAWVTSRAANLVESPAFLVMASASVSTIGEDRLWGREAQMRHLGAGDEAIAQGVELLTLDHRVTRTGEGYEELLSAWKRCREERWFADICPERDPLPKDSPHRMWERTVLDFDPRPELRLINAPVLWIFGDPTLDRFSPVQMSTARVEAAKASGMPYQIIQIDGVGHTLELEGERDLQTLVQVQVPLLWQIFNWLSASTVTRPVE